MAPGAKSLGSIRGLRGQLTFEHLNNTGDVTRFEPTVMFEEGFDIPTRIAAYERAVPDDEMASGESNRPTVTHKAMLTKQRTLLENKGQVSDDHIDFAR